MIRSLSVFVFSVLIAVTYIVIFASVYPNTTIDSSLVFLLALLGIATCLIVLSFGRLLQRTRQRSNPRRLAKRRKGGHHT